MEDQKEMYEKSDKSLKIMRIILITITWIFTIAFIGVGIFFMGIGSEVAVGLGCAFFFGGPLISVSTYYITKFFLWVVFDIKVIRTAVTTKEMSDALQSFDKIVENKKTKGDFENAMSEL